MSFKTVVKKILYFVLNYILSQIMAARNAGAGGLSDPKVSERLLEIKRLTDDLTNSK